MPLQDLFAPSTRTSPQGTPTLQEFVYGKKEEGRGFMGYLELLGRPQLALGEAIGALARDEEMVAAAKRGWSGERKYGTLGEQIFEEDPKLSALEALARKGAAVGVDIATDPTWIFGLPAAGKLAGVAGKALPHAKKLPLMRDIAKYVVPITTQLRWFGRRSGKKIAALFESADDAAGLRVAQASIELAQAAKTLGVGRSTALRVAAREHLESGRLTQGVLHSDKRVQAFAQYMDETLKKVGLEVESFKDLTGEGFKIVEPALRSIRSDVIARAKKLGLTSRKNRNALWDYVTTGVAPATAIKGFDDLARFTVGKLDKVGFARVPGSPSIFSKEFVQRPFQSIPNYFPHLSTPDTLKAIGTKEGFSKAVREVAKTNGISEFEAAKILRNIGAPRRAGNIEYARTLNMKYEKDPLKALPRYFEQVLNRVEYAKRFGVRNQELNRLLKQSMTRTVRTKGGGYREIKGISKSDASLIRDTISGAPPDRKGYEKVARAIMGYQVMTKMGPLSTLANISQNANTIVKEGGVSFLKGVMRSMGNEGQRQGAIAYAGGIHEHLLRMMGATGKGAEWWLRKSGFIKAERINRLLASNAGIVEAERLLRQSGGILTRPLARRGLTQTDVQMAKANGWKLPTQVADRIGLIASNATQHVTRMKDIPLAWQGPGMRMMVQFKSFVYQQTRFLLREVMKPALKYFETNGKEGAIAPLARMAATFGLGGGFIAQMRDWYKAGGTWVAGKAGFELEHKPREAVPDDWALRVLEDSLNMGGLGVAGDLVQRAARRDFKGWLLGPSYGDVSDMIEMTATGGAGMYKKGEIDLAQIGAEALRHVPMVSPIFPKRGLKKAVEGSLEALFYGK